VPGLTPERAPKYLDPKASPAYQKKRYLYGLDKARSQRYCHIVEGPLDSLALAQNSIATMGCHLTDEQARIVAHYFVSACIMYDGDVPGIEAAFPACATLERHGVPTSIAILPDGMDPAEWAPLRMLPALFDYEQLMTGHMTPLSYDLSLMQSLAKPYVEDNIKAGFPHYNVIDYVMQAQPEVAEELRAAVLAMRDGCVEKEGRMVPQEAQVRAVLRAWFKGCRALRLKRDGKDR
jgi:hypothetical protein